jgi:DNA-binding NarL/FixJ family response regulator
MFRRLAALAGSREVVADDAQLTSRERQILKFVDEGLSNKEIAHRLQIGVSTVKNHVHRILEKLHVSRRGEAAARLRRTVAGVSAQIV